MDEKSNEITSIPKLLAALELSGTVVTADALGCQRSIAHQIVEKKADYVLAVKENQGHLHERASRRPPRRKSFVPFFDELRAPAAFSLPYPR